LSVEDIVAKQEVEKAKEALEAQDRVEATRLAEEERRKEIQERKDKKIIMRTAPTQEQPQLKKARRSHG
jgi:hypothetical protein